MTPDPSRDRRPLLQVDPEHPGVNERAWEESTELGRLRPLRLPEIEEAVLVAPHPDDEVLGSGGLLRVLAAAAVRVEIIAVTDGEAFAGGAGTPAADLRRIRSAESTRALARLGLRDFGRRRLLHPDGAVAQVEEHLADQLAGYLRPGTLCIAPWRHDGHPDHDACGRAAARATEATGSALLEYPVWAWHWARPDGDDLPWESCRRLDLEPPTVAAKRRAIGAFRSQIQAFGPAGTPPVLPASVLGHFTRTFEVFIQ